jgi:5-enolpyruvylshikimate-3-phosphate synthase
MRERPIRDLVDGLRQLGVDVTCSDEGCPPVGSWGHIISLVGIIVSF